MSTIHRSRLLCLGSAVVFAFMLLAPVAVNAEEDEILALAPVAAPSVDGPVSMRCRPRPVPSPRSTRCRAATSAACRKSACSPSWPPRPHGMRRVAMVQSRPAAPPSDTRPPARSARPNSSHSSAPWNCPSAAIWEWTSRSQPALSSRPTADASSLTSIGPRVPRPDPCLLSFRMQSRGEVTGDLGPGSLVPVSVSPE